MISQLAKLSSRLSSNKWGNYKRTQQGALAALLLYLYKLHVVCATTILTCSYVHALSSCPITHPPYIYLKASMLYTCALTSYPNPYSLSPLSMCALCVYYVYTMRNSCPLTSFLTLTLYLDFSQSF